MTNDLLFQHVIESEQPFMLFEECAESVSLPVMPDSFLDEMMPSLPENIQEAIRERRCIVVGGPDVSSTRAAILVLGASMSDREVIVADRTQLAAQRLLEDAVLYVPPIESKRKAQWLEDRYHPFRRRGIPR